MTIAIVVQGRFHAFDLARELVRQGEDVTVYTSYPAWAARRLGLPAGRVRTCWTHFVISQVWERCRLSPLWLEGWRHRWFGRWAARALAGARWDLVHCWSGVSEELLRAPGVDARARWVMRGSAHIEDQAALLAEEAARVHAAIERPSAWMIARERREYDLADGIVLLSEFARQSFLRRGTSDARLRVIPLGVDVAAFRAPAAVRRARAERIRGGAPIRVAYAGALSAQKGLADLMEAARATPAHVAEFSLIGPATAETSRVMGKIPSHVRRVGKLNQRDLPAAYWAHDVFVFPTIQDGFGMVLTQAMAAGLLVIATPHSAGPDLIEEGRTGWIIPVRQPAAIADRLRWCHEHRDDAAALCDGSGATDPADWSEVASRFRRALLPQEGAASNGH
jgi:glycosyltransferase involved in cell wall biosynthesis